jgi:hypothetical protein
MLRLQSLAIIGLLATVGCASGKPDRPARVGNYNYDSAVKELGPPDKTETLSDGTRVADWFVTRRGGMTVSLGLASFGGNTAVGTGTTLGTVGARPTLRLTFGADGKLVSVQEVGK